MILGNTRKPTVLLPLKSKPYQEKASSGLLGSNPLKVRSAQLAKLMVWIPPIQNSRGCEWVKFFPGRRQGEGLRGTGSLRNPGPWSARLGLPGMGQSPGSRFRCLGPRTHTVRTKGASFCLKAPAARLPHRNISATGTLYHLLAFPLTDRTTGQTPWAPARSTSPAPLTRTLRKLLLPASGGYWPVKLAC